MQYITNLVLMKISCQFCHSFIYYTPSELPLTQILTAGGGSNNEMWTRMRERMLGVTTRLRFLL